MRLAFVFLLWLQSPAEAQLHVRAIAATNGDVVLRVGNRSVGRMTDVLCTIQRYQDHLRKKPPPDQNQPSQRGAGGRPR